MTPRLWRRVVILAVSHPSASKAEGRGSPEGKGSAVKVYGTILDRDK